MFKSHASRGFLICFGVTLVVLALYIFNGLDSLELKSVDFRFQLRGNRVADPNIVVITVDEKSIAEMGRWPWPRSTHGKLTRSLDKAGVKAISFDVLLTEADLSNPAADAAFAEAAADTGKVTSAFFFPKKLQHDLIGENPLMPYPALKEHSANLGFVNLDPDKDGVCRHAALYAIVGDEVYPSLAVATLTNSLDKPLKDVLPTLPIVINTNPYLAENKIFINYAYSPTEDAYKTYSYVDVLQGRVDLKEFKDKIVIVGGTATALFDVIAMPFASSYFGLYTHANIIDNLIAGNYMRGTSGEMAGLYIFLIGLIMAFLLPRLSPLAKLGIFVVLGAAIVTIAQWLFSKNNLVVPMVAPLLIVVGCYGGILFYRLVVEEREKRKIKGSFRQYLSPKIIDILTKDPSKLKLGGEEREVSIFFLDIAGFTTMSETLKPTQLVEVMNHCLTEFSNVVLKHDGLINKYIGDCIMAFWNAPADQPRHASQACLAALECISILPKINQSFEAKGLPAIDCRVGVNTGTVVVGNMGSNEKFDYTVLGDPVNLASRLEGANKQYHTRIMISEVTFEKAREDIEARDLDLIRVKGKKEPKKVFEVLCKKGEMSEQIVEGRKRYHQGLALYRQRNFAEAIEAFQSVFEFLPNDRVTRVYLERARSFVNNPPPALWDGVYEMTSK